MDLIVTDKLTKIYNKHIVAVDHIDLNIKEGEIFGLLGPNGAGKTTTIRMLSTLTRPTSGTATVAGYDIQKDSRKVRQLIGYSAQAAGLMENATGRENLDLFGRYHHMDGGTLKKRIDELLALVNLTEDAKRLVKTYSGGDAQAAGDCHGAGAPAQDALSRRAHSGAGYPDKGEYLGLRAQAGRCRDYHTADHALP